MTTAVQDIQYKLEEAKKLFCAQEELIAKQEHEIALEQRHIEELATLTTESRQSVCDLKHQLEMKNGQERLASINF